MSDNIVNIVATSDDKKYEYYIDNCGPGWAVYRSHAGEAAFVNPHIQVDVFEDLNEAKALRDKLVMKEKK